MANLSYYYNSAEKVWVVQDVNAGVKIAAYQNEIVAANIARAGDGSQAAINVGIQQDINLSGGTQITPIDQPGPVPSSEFPNLVNTNNGVSYTSSSSLTQAEQDALVNRLNANGPAPVSVVTDPLYAGGVRPGTSEELQRNNSTLTEQQALDSMYITTIDPVTGEEVRSSTVAEQRAVDSMYITGGNNVNPSTINTARDVPGNLIYQYPSSPTGSTPFDDEGNIMPGWTLDEGNNPVWAGDGFVEPGLAASAEASRIEAFKEQARQQQAISSQRRNVNGQDWRVRLRLAPQANYLYKASNPGILQPLAVTDGVIFPYTPEITVPYRATYSSYDLTHSNFRGYFYKNSYVDAITLSCPFTAQDTQEANYLLAVLTFFKSATKMFYGGDAERGAPPPLLYLTGHGEYQFNEMPCLIQQFNMVLPPDVDYIRCGSPNNNQTNLTTARDRASVLPSGLFGTLLSSAATRLSNSFLYKGAISAPPPPPTLGQDRVSYVPTKMNISLSLLPVNSRRQMSQFSLKQFANGDLIKGGFW